MSDPTTVAIGDWEVITTHDNNQTFHTITYHGQQIAGVMVAGGRWRSTHRPHRDDPAIPFVVFKAIPHNEGALRQLLYN